MRLRPQEKKKEFQEAILSIIVFFIPLAALIYFSHTYFQARTQKLDTDQKQSLVVFDKNRKEIEEIRIIQGNQGEIDATWNLLNRWNQGSFNQESADILTKAGFATVVPMMEQSSNVPGVPGNTKVRPGTPPRGNNVKRPGAPSTYSKLQANSERTEFLRFLLALDRIERTEGLSQVERAYLSLPDGTAPYGEAASYLNIDMILATPSAIR